VTLVINLTVCWSEWWRVRQVHRLDH